MALAAYRHILRSIPVAFKGDTPLLANARQKARHSFEENRRLSPDSEEVQQGIRHAEEVARVLRQNVVQGRVEAAGENYKLRIHDETERGDNETVKLSGERMREKPVER